MKVMIMYDLYFFKLRQFATDEKKLTKQIKEQHENEMKICATRQKTAYKNNKTKFKKVRVTSERLILHVCW